MEPCRSAACPPCPGHRGHLRPGGEGHCPLPTGAPPPPGPVGPPAPGVQQAGVRRQLTPTLPRLASPASASAAAALPHQPPVLILVLLVLVHPSVELSGQVAGGRRAAPSPSRVSGSHGGCYVAAICCACLRHCGTAANADGLRRSPGAMDGLAPQQSRCQCERCRDETNQLSPLPSEKGVHLRAPLLGRSSPAPLLEDIYLTPEEIAQKPRGLGKRLDVARRRRRQASLRSAGGHAIGAGSAANQLPARGVSRLRAAPGRVPSPALRKRGCGAHLPQEGYFLLDFFLCPPGRPRTREVTGELTEGDTEDPGSDTRITEKPSSQALPHQNAGPVLNLSPPRTGPGT
ncbi:uncharacterized protein [Notamacropus eugenii]|uniref:uncharacterized protein isoform X2 n=1 Tax=Notamacropus eugenii TaxID=9315 RepID=UPI003B6841BB